MKLLTWNIQAGIATSRYRDYLLRAHRQFVHTSGKAIILENIAKWIVGHDVVCLQEVDLGGRRAGFRCQATDLAAMSGYEHIERQENRKVRGLSCHGNAILSRWPLRDVRDLKLPGRLGGRGCLIATIESPIPITVACLHLSLGRSDQSLQLEFLAEQLRQETAWIVMGDFNCQAHSSVLTKFCDQSGAQRPRHAPSTFPSWKPRWDYDHIIPSAGLTLSAPRRLSVVASDHLPIEAALYGPSI